ncbi:MAG TPA: ankyrin repeat domain-containing protein [Candidatus Rifleibacterium sp.]|nr:ankyrin repeat domain-containing protein [Candidatus Rifleibacterium sp.]HPT47263.1 ankyrin repeat domain-containing protein [Candidatus Rifleibacterium sp.]
MKFSLSRVAMGILLLILALCSARLSAANFHKLVVDGELEAVRREISRDGELATMNDELGRSPLHLAVIHGHMALVNVLINAGADVNATDRLKNYTPLHYAAFYRFPGITLFLLGRRADYLMADRDGNLPMHIAAATGCPQIVKTLIQHKASPDCLNNNWQTPLHLAAINSGNRHNFPAASDSDADYLEVARLLLEAGATTGIHDIWRNLPETLAWQNGRRSRFPGNFAALMKEFRRMQ